MASAASAAPAASGGPDPGEEPVASFEELFRTRYEGMIRVAFLLVGSQAEAEDVVQDAFARVNLRWKRSASVPARSSRCCTGPWPS